VDYKCLGRGETHDPGNSRCDHDGNRIQDNTRHVHGDTRGLDNIRRDHDDNQQLYQKKSDNYLGGVLK